DNPRRLCVERTAEEAVGYAPAQSSMPSVAPRRGKNPFDDSKFAGIVTFTDLTAVLGRGAQQSPSTTSRWKPSHGSNWKPVRRISWPSPTAPRRPEDNEFTFVQPKVNAAQRVHHNLAHAVCLYEPLRLENGGSLGGGRWAFARCNHVDSRRAKRVPPGTRNERRKTCASYRAVSGAARLVR